MKRKMDILIKDESKLSKLLFNNTENFVENLKKTDIEENKIDKKPVWLDEDDEQFGKKANHQGVFKEKLQNKYHTLLGTPSWALLNKKQSEEDDNPLLRTVGHLQKNTSNNLKKGLLEYKKLSKLNDGSEGQIVSCIEFHPKLSDSLVTGRTGAVSLYSVGAENNNKLHSFTLKNWEIFAAHFTPDGSQAVIASKVNRVYCIYDVVKAQSMFAQLPKVVKAPTIFVLSPNGKYLAISDGFDEVYIVCSASKELLRCLKHNNNVASVTFNSNSDKLYCYCIQGEVTVWDMNTYKALYKFYDQGCVTASCITESVCGRLLATGSGEGIINVYETERLNLRDPVPINTVLNLTTKISSLKFNPSTEILAAASNSYPNALKLVHLPSCHVFSNFPQESTNINLVDAVSFSPNSGYIGVGNNKGSALLFRLKYYKNY